MKRYIRTSTDNNVTNIEVTFGALLSIETTQVAATSYKGHEIPEGKLPPADKKALLNSQVYQDYLAFLEAIDEIIFDYDLKIYYENESETNSLYRSGLAKDSKGDILLKFAVHIRVSTHPAHRTKESQKNKKEERAELTKLAGKKKVTPLPINVVVNDKAEDFASYLDAIVYFDERLAHAVEIMKRN